ncbi:hypothetical protein JRO89_XS04G0057000 [Xanthoceras sorbifolium]|uniref:BED-type domain-containing protein n=1 Tax=Xanthoceras sorbifolium TaxID=99658 RepID=A0ABQ8I4J7_9ROSI|nr:hypothetical protein JRO89_XS04G0057000 [Xanthoceras sorbifolium]
MNDSAGNASSNPSASQLNVRDQAPLWQYVTKVDKVGTGGGNISFQCNFCHQVYRGSYSRVKCHLLKTKGGGIASCSKVTSATLFELNQVVEEAVLRLKQSLPRQVPLPSANTMASGSLSKTCSTGASGLSFHFARNPHYVRAFTKAYNNTIAGYVPPGYNALRTTLLQKENTNIERILRPIKSSWKDRGVSLCSDGWSDSQRKPLINIMAVCESGPMFLRAVNCEGEYKDKYFIANLLIESLREIGPQNVMQVITYNAAACKAAELLVEAKFQHIFWTLCVVHTLNLALKNICSPSSHPRYDDVMEQCGWISKITSDAMFIKKFIMNHSMRLAMFNDHSKLKLLSIAETHFASAIIMLKRFKQIKQSLEHMVISERWDMYKEDDTEKARAVKEKILDEYFWIDMYYIINFTTSIYEMIRMANMDIPCLHLVYEWWDSMIEKMKIVIFRKERKQLNEELRFFDVVHGILVERWTKSSTPLYCLAHSLNPRYYHDSWLEECPDRVPPHKDTEITRERKKCLERYFSNPEERRKIYGEFASFSGAIEDFAGANSMEDRGFMSPMKWWLFHGASTPTLQSIALKLLGFIFMLRSPTYNEGPSQQWDVGGDGFDSINMENSGILEIADLSLDEPDLEDALFNSTASGSIIVDK